MFAGRHRWQHRIGLRAKLARVGRSEQRQFVRRRSPRFPRALSPVKTQRAHGVGIGKIKYLYEEHGEAMSLMHSIKKALDPDNIMNPGKVL